MKIALLSLGATSVGNTQTKPDCPGLPDAAHLKTVVQGVVHQGAAKNGGLGNQEWAAVVNRDGIVCAIVFSGIRRSDQWSGSRRLQRKRRVPQMPSVERTMPLSTANIYAASQPGQSLYSLATSQPPNPAAIVGDPTTFGAINDPMVGKAIGGVIVFDGGIPLYASDGNIVGGLGLSGDTSFTDHVIAWKVRHELHLDTIPMGPSSDHNDNMILDWSNNTSASGFGHPSCKGETGRTGLSKILRKIILLASTVELQV